MTAMREIINSLLEIPVIFDKTEPLAPSIRLQRFQTNLTKSCILNLVAIEDFITQLTKMQVHSRADTATFLQNAIPGIELWGLATLSAPMSKHKEFVCNLKMTSYLPDLNTKYPITLKYICNWS
jgi:hypothetical protein